MGRLILRRSLVTAGLILLLGMTTLAAAQQKLGKEEVLKELAKTYWQMKDYPKATECYRKLSQMGTTDRDKSYYIYWIAMGLSGSKKYQEAMDVNEEVIEKYSHVKRITAYSYYMKAFTNYKLGQLDESLKWYKFLIDTFPPDYLVVQKAQLQIGRVLYFARRYEESRAAFLKVVNNSEAAPALIKEAQGNVETIEHLFLNK